ncbi:MAG: hypothetical protein KF901_05350 [Myxococcales bacterium]|nr:hypothetical protein [Myxococcales bacterium]
MGAPGERVFEALWAPRWFGLDQSLAAGQESALHFRSPVPCMGIVVLAAGLDRPRYETRCRVLGLKHPVLGRLQALEVDKVRYRIVRHDGGVVVLDANGGGLVSGLAAPPPDWTVRVVLEQLS